jgi:hypothetical protein
LNGNSNEPLGRSRVSGKGVGRLGMTSRGSGRVDVDVDGERDVDEKGGRALEMRRGL